jgi:hypothetical protein
VVIEPSETDEGVAVKLEIVGPPVEGFTAREAVVVALWAALSFT